MHEMRDSKEIGLSERLSYLAKIVAAIRPDWDYPGIYSVLNKSSAPLADLAIAALLAARDRTDGTTPLVITMDGNHWRASGKIGNTHAESSLPDTDRPRCQVCSRYVSEAEHDLLMRDWYAPEDRHAYQPQREDEYTQAEYGEIGTRGAAAVRQALKAARSE